MRKTQAGFFKSALIILLALFAFLYFYKDEHGVRYLDKLIKMPEDLKTKGQDSVVDPYKKIMGDRNKEIEQNLK